MDSERGFLASKMERKMRRWWETGCHKEARKQYDRNIHRRYDPEVWAWSFLANINSDDDEIPDFDNELGLEDDSWLGFTD